MKVLNALNQQVMISVLLLTTTLIFVVGACTDLQGPEMPEGEVVEIVANHDHESNEHSFEMSKKEFASGWTKLRFINNTNSLHFFNMFKLPQEAMDAAEAAGQPLLDHWYETITVPCRWGDLDLHPQTRPQRRRLIWNQVRTLQNVM